MFKAACINELYKLSRKKKIIVGAILTLAAVLLGALVVSLLDNFGGVRLAGSASLPVLMLHAVSYTLLPIFMILVTTDMFGGEFRDETIKQSFLRPVLRRKIFFAKLAACLIFLCGAVLFTLLLSLLASVVIGVGQLAVGRICLAYLVTVLPLFVFTLYAALISLFVRSTGGAFAVSVLSFLIMLALGAYSSVLQSVLFTAAFDWHLLFSGIHTTFGKLSRMFFMLLGWCALLGGVGLYVFERRDV